METYVSSMSKLHRIEDTQPECKPILLQPFLSSLYESAKIVCAQNEKELRLQNEVSVSRLSLDSSFISQVCNNLISNAVRYAQTTVTSYPFNTVSGVRRSCAKAALSCLRSSTCLHISEKLPTRVVRIISKEVHSCPNSSLLSYSIENFKSMW